MSASLLIDILLWGSVAAVGLIAWQRGPIVLTSSLRQGTREFIGIIPRIALGVVGSGYIAAVIPQEIITGWLGPNSGWLGVATAVVAGAATPGGPVVGFSIGAVALKSGGGSPQVLAYVIAWALLPSSGSCSGKFHSCHPASSISGPRSRSRSPSWRQPSPWRSVSRNPLNRLVDIRNVIM